MLFYNVSCLQIQMRCKIWAGGGCVITNEAERPRCRVTAVRRCITCSKSVMLQEKHNIRQPTKPEAKYPNICIVNRDNIYWDMGDDWDLPNTYMHHITWRNTVWWRFTKIWLYNDIMMIWWLHYFNICDFQFNKVVFWSITFCPLMRVTLRTNFKIQTFLCLSGLKYMSRVIGLKEAIARKMKNVLDLNVLKDKQNRR